MKHKKYGFFLVFFDFFLSVFEQIESKWIILTSLQKGLRGFPFGEWSSFVFFYLRRLAESKSSQLVHAAALNYTSTPPVPEGETQHVDLG